MFKLLMGNWEIKIALGDKPRKFHFCPARQTIQNRINTKYRFLFKLSLVLVCFFEKKLLSLLICKCNHIATYGSSTFCMQQRTRVFVTISLFIFKRAFPNCNSQPHFNFRPPGPHLGLSELDHE